MQRLGVQHELPALGRRDRGGNGDLATELVQCPALPRPMHSTSGARNG
jgi:hypothetical protein